MPLPSCVASQICIYLEDLRALSCAARGCVTLADWRRQAEGLLPGATRYLPGGPQFQVHTLLGKRAPQQIDPTSVGPCAHGCIALLELRQSCGVLWRSVSRITLRDAGHASTDGAVVDVAEFTFADGAADGFERVIFQWGFAHHNLPATACDIACVLQICLPNLGGNPRIVQPRLVLEGIRWERCAWGGLVGHLEFAQLKNPLETTTTIHLRIVTYRPEFSARGMDSPIAARAWLGGFVEGQHDRLDTYIRQICHVCNTYRVGP
jgi:hypothetical protein